MLLPYQLTRIICHVKLKKKHTKAFTINSATITHFIWSSNQENTKYISTSSNSLTAHKVSDVVFHAKPRTKSFRRAGSALATLLISSAIEGYWDPLHARTCKQGNKHTHTMSIQAQHTTKMNKQPSISHSTRTSTTLICINTNGKILRHQ